MIPVTVIPAPGVFGGGVSPGVGGSGNPPDGGGNVPLDLPSRVTSGANGSRRPDPRSAAPNKGGGCSGETRGPDDTEGAFSPDRAGVVAAGGSAGAAGPEVVT